MKKPPILLLTLALCATFLAACGSADSSFSIHPDADGHGIDDSAPADSTAAPASAAAESNPDEVHSVTGTIYDTGMSKFYVEVEGGLVIPFHYDGADVDDLLDTRPGSPITVYYTGVLEGDDASGVIVVRMETPD